MVPLGLTLTAVLLSGPVPTALSRLPRMRRAPRAAMVLWQAVALAAVLSALGAGLSPAGRSHPHGGTLWNAGVAAALLLTAVVVGRLLLSGHRVGMRIRETRRRHRALVDVLSAEEGDVRVLEHAAPLAYCVPGVQRSRVVVTVGARRRLEPEEMAAVLAHERAHLRARHDLVLEAFTVLHEAFPRLVSSRAALGEVALLVEVLADRAARRRTGARPLARALVELADAAAPEATLAAGGTGLLARLELLRDDRPHRVFATLLLLASAVVVTLPVYQGMQAISLLPW